MSAEQLLTDHLDLWTSAVTYKSGRGAGKGLELTGIKKLRELILELAVRGKLVEQDPNDEPASVLLERIAEEKAQLIKEGKLKNSKRPVDLASEKADFELPNSWLWVRLDSVGQVVGGGTPKSGEPTYWADKGIAWLTPADLYGRDEKYIKYGKRDISELGLEKSSAQLLPEGSVLFSSRAPIGYVAITAKPLATNQGFKSCVPYVRETNQFIYCFLKRSARYIDEGASGTTFKEVSGSKVASIAMPLPPLQEQHRIVAKVDELMALCDRLEQQTGDQLDAHEVLIDTLLDALTRAENADEVAAQWARLAEYFDTLFTTEASIDKLKKIVIQLAIEGKIISFNAKRKLLKDILSFGPRNGFSPKESNYKTGFKALKLGATTTGKLDIRESKNVDINESKSSHLWLEKGDILIQRGNSPSHVGCNVMVDKDYPDLIYPDLMMKIRVREEVDPKYISIYLSSITSRRFMWDRMTGTSGTMPKISKKVVESVPIELPDLYTQRKVLRKIDEIFSLCDKLQLQLLQANDKKNKLADSWSEKALNNEY